MCHYMWWWLTLLHQDCCSDLRVLLVLLLRSLQFSALWLLLVLRWWTSLLLKTPRDTSKCTPCNIWGFVFFFGRINTGNMIDGINKGRWYTLIHNNEHWFSLRNCFYKNIYRSSTVFCGNKYILFDQTADKNITALRPSVNIWRRHKSSIHKYESIIHNNASSSVKVHLLSTLTSKSSHILV